MENYESFLFEEKNMNSIQFTMNPKPMLLCIPSVPDSNPHTSNLCNCEEEGDASP